MPELLRVSLELSDALDRYCKTENSRSADYSFANIYMWDERFCQSVALCGDRLVTLLHRKGETYFAFPIGSGSLDPAFSFMREYCRENGIPLRLCGLLHEHVQMLNEYCPSGFEFSEDRDYSDYIYLTEKLAEYPGRHLHSKRNFCNRFEAEHDWKYVPMTKELLGECRELLDSWLHDSAERLTDDISYETSAITRCFDSFELLKLEGGVLYADGRPVGFTVGEVISEDTYCTHFEKAFSDLDGAYPMLCRECARQIQKEHPEISYVNREDDMGNPSLRRSKLSYKPESILIKYLASEK